MSKDNDVSKFMSFEQGMEYAHRLTQSKAPSERSLGRLMRMLLPHVLKWVEEERTRADIIPDRQRRTADIYTATDISVLISGTAIRHILGAEFTDLHPEILRDIKRRMSLQMDYAIKKSEERHHQ